MIMHRKAVLLSLIVLASGLPAISQESSETGEKKRIAMVLPKAPANVAVKTTPVSVQSQHTSVSAETSSVEPATEFGSHVHPKEKEIPDSFKAAIIDGAEKLEMLSRSYNQRIADFILWMLSSMKTNPTITPHASPYFKPFIPAEHKSFPGVRSTQQIFQID